MQCHSVLVAAAARLRSAHGYPHACGAGLPASFTKPHSLLPGKARSTEQTRGMEWMRGIECPPSMQDGPSLLRTDKLVEQVG